MSDFSTIGDKSDKPETFYEGRDDNSTGVFPPYKMQTGVLRGTQTIVNRDKSKITIGIIPGTNNEFGIAIFDPDGNLIRKWVGATGYVYDPSSSKNTMQDGKLPDDSYGLATANEGFDVDDGF